MSGFQRVLVIDSAMDGCNVAYYDASRDICEVDSFEGARGQAEKLVPMVQGVLGRASGEFADIQAIVVVNGPGTFTGIRIGLSSARAFGFALGVPVYGVSSLQALAVCYAGRGDGRDDFTAVVETRRADYYVQAFSADGSAKDEARSVLAGDVQAQRVIGDAAARLAGEKGGDLEVVGGYERIDVCAVARCFCGAFCDEDKRDAYFSENPEPIYLRAPDVSLPKTPPRRLEGKTTQ